VMPARVVGNRPGGPVGMADTIIDYQDAAVEVHRVVVGPMDNNVYIVRCRETGEAVLIDAANEHELLLELCRALGVRSVVETHGHWDHIQAVEAVRDAGFDVAVTQADSAMLPSYDRILEDEATLRSAGCGSTPSPRRAHPGSMCFAVEGTPCCSPATPCSRRSGQHLVRERRLRHHHRVDRLPAVPPVRPGHPGAAGHGPAPPSGPSRPSSTSGSSGAGSRRRRFRRRWRAGGAPGPPRSPGQSGDGDAARHLVADLDGHPGSGQGIPSTLR